jgi:hypothetical protein
VKNDVDAGAKKVAQNDDSPAPTATDVSAEGTGSPMIPGSAGDPTDEEKVKERPKGCGCAIPTRSNDAVVYGVPAGSILALGFLAARRRRRDRSRDRS